MRIDSPLMNNAVATGSFTGSFIGAIEAESLSGAAYTTFSSSIASGISTNASDITALQTFSSSLDATFATDAELSSVSASLAGDITTNSNRLTTIESIEIFSGSVQVDHDQTTNFDANEHIDHTSVTLTAGNGLTGGGDISTSRTFTVGAGDGITVNADDIQVDATVLRTTGGGILSSSAQVDHDQTTNFVTNEHIDHSSVSITAGAGLTGGGDLTSTRTLNIGAGTGVTVNADDIAIGQDVATSADVTFNNIAVSNDVTISGNLSVLGDATQLQVSALNVEDINITIASGAADSAAANGAGITIAGANESLTWDHGNSYFNFSDDLNVTGNITATGTIDGVDVAGLNTSFNTLEGKTLISSSDQVDHDQTTNYDANKHFTQAQITTVGTVTSGDVKAILPSGTVSGSVQVAHDSTTGFVANEHIDHSTVSITAGSGLTGGGTIASTRTLNIGQGTGITVSADSIATNDSQIVHDNLSGFVANEHIDHSTITMTAGSGLTGGGTIEATRTFNVGQGDGISVTADAVSVDGTVLRTTGDSVISASAQIDHDATTNFVANEHINHTSVTLTAGSGLTGGGTIAASRTFNVGQGDGITVSADAVAVDSTVARKNVDNNFSVDQTFGNITVNGTGSFAYIQSTTGSAKIIGDNYIVLNNSTPSQRYAGIQVYDSGSAGVTASLEFDGQINDWFYQYSDDGGATSEFGAVIFGPQYGTKGTPTYPSSNKVQKGTGGHHIADSNITDTGTLISLGTTTDITGSLRATADVIAYHSSDEALKDNITPIENAVEKVNLIGGYEFDWNNKQNIHTGHDIGVIAQEVEKVLPEIVATRDNGYKAVKYEKLTAVLIQAVKELSARVKELENK